MSIAPIVKSKTPAQLADNFGKLLADKAALAKREKALKDELFKVAKRDKDGMLFVDGSAFRVTISEVAPGKTFDAAKAKKLLSDAMIAQCMKRKAGSLSYRAKALVADKAAA